MADLIVLVWFYMLGLKKQLKRQGYSVSVPFTQGRGDASQRTNRFRIFWIFRANWQMDLEII